MGLAAALQALREGHQVEVLEAGPEPGGMAAHFDLHGLSIERFYHFICKTDHDTFRLLRELGIEHKLHWRATSMGLFTGGKLHPWGTPTALLRFPGISLLSRLRYGLFALVCARRDRWDALETASARAWIERWCGREVYTKLWQPLFRLKFHQYAEDISAAWIWTRIKRIGRSRRSVMQEELGYLQGGSQTLIDALCARIREMGGTIHTNCPALQVCVRDNRVTGVHTPGGCIEADFVLSTIPTPYVSSLVPTLDLAWKARYDTIHNTGVCCLVFKLARRVSPHFWVNISEPDIEVPGIIEFSNLRPVADAGFLHPTAVREEPSPHQPSPVPPSPVPPSVVYVPYYMPADHPKFGWTDQALLAEAFSYLQRINPALTETDILARHVARLRHAQPICEPGFAARLPSIQTHIEGLQIADTCFYYPEDRGISESLRLGRHMARNLHVPESVARTSELEHIAPN